MQKILILPLFLVLISCSTITTSKFDNIEYSSYVKLLTMVEEAPEYCGDRESINQYVTIMKTESAFLANYTTYKQYNEDSMEISARIKVSIDKLYNRYQTATGISENYCQAKFLILNRMLKSVVKVTATRLKE